MSEILVISVWETNHINLTNEIKYLRIFIVSGKCFACNLHSCKIKFFRALNAILGKIGDMSALNLILSLTSTPILIIRYVPIMA